MPPAPVDAAWIGEGGEWLTTDALAGVDDLHARAVDIEPRITAIMDTMPDGLPNVTTVGREHVLKCAESLRRKVATTILLSGKATISDTLSGLNDSIRYTFQSTDESLASNVNSMTARLLESGFKPTRWTSAWSGDSYRGVNSTWRDPSGHLIEVQFHTWMSLWAKEFTHGWYEDLRLPNVEPTRTVELRKLQAEVFDTVPQPADFRRIVDPRS